MGSTKLLLPNLKGIHPESLQFLIQSYFMFMQFICFLFIYFLKPADVLITILFICLSIFYIGDMN